MVVQTLTAYGILRFRTAADVTLVVLAGIALATLGRRGGRRAATG